MKKSIYIIILLIAIGFSSFAQTIDLQKGLITYYPFNGNANDESGNGNDGTVYGADLTADRNGKPDSAYEFDGDNDCIYSNNDLELYNSYSVSIWIYKSDTWENEFQKILCVGNGANNFAFCLSQGPSPKYFYFYPHGSLRRSLIIIQSPIVNKWHHITMIYTGEEAKLYLNNKFLGNSYFKKSINIKSPLRIGWAYRNEYFKGKIDDIRIYNRAINENEIEALYNLHN